jgi:hypothetical protein
VYWASPGIRDPTDIAALLGTEGIQPMVAVGSVKTLQSMFYDTAILANADLTTPAVQYFFMQRTGLFLEDSATLLGGDRRTAVVWLYDTI